MKEDLFIYLQYMIPQALTSRLISKLAESKNRILKNYLINLAIRKFEINIDEAEFSNIDNYETFNAFFTRKLKDGARPITERTNVISSPAEGILSWFGKIKNKTLIQAKGKSFSLESLIANSSKTEFTDFTTIYLSPKDYHRVHMPIDGKLTKMTYITGKLFSVNRTNASKIDSLFAKNERLVCYFDTKIGEIAVIFVGALLVAGIETTWHGKITPSYYKDIQTWDYNNKQYNIEFKKGDTLGLFNFGSTIITLFPENKVSFDFDKKGMPIQVNQNLAIII